MSDDLDFIPDTATDFSFFNVAFGMSSNLSVLQLLPLQIAG